jgi:molecular chaperone GrpE
VEETRRTRNKMSKKESKKEAVEEIKENEPVDEVVDENEVKIKELEEKLAESQDRYLRTLAEYDNFRKRSIKERDGIYADAYSDAIKNLLPIIDNLERVLTLEGDEKFMEGLRLILNSVYATLEKMGVTEIETKSFDPNLHNAVMHVDDENLGEGEIVEVFQKGYMFKDRVIRYAMVKVAN